jgi:hypothetical protein
VGAEEIADGGGGGDVELATTRALHRMAGGAEGGGDGLAQPAFASGNHNKSAHAGEGERTFKERQGDAAR